MTESKYLPAACRAAIARANSLQIKGKTRARDEEAFMQGALAVATAAGLMSFDRAQQIAFLCVVGRLPDFIKQQAAIPPEVDSMAPTDGEST